MSLSRQAVLVRSLSTKKEWRQVPPISPTIKVSSFFNKAFGKYLIFTNILTTGALMVIGDLMEQEIEYRRDILPERYDWYRSSRMLLVGFALAPVPHVFYKYLDKYLPTRNLVNVAKMVFLDQLFVAPTSIGVFFYGIGILEGNTIKECTQEIKSKFIEVYRVDCCVWPPTQFINFYFMPLQYRVIYSNFVMMIYNVFLSYIKHRKLTEETSNTHVNTLKSNNKRLK